jgi:hypothetical protein
MNAKRNISAASGFRLAEDDDPAPRAGLINQRRGRRGHCNDRTYAQTLEVNA